MEAMDNAHIPETKMEHSTCNLIVNYLPHDIDDYQLKELFSEDGEIIRAKVVCERSTGKSSCFGFVLFKNRHDAQRAVENKNGMSVGMKRLKVGFARPPKSPESRNCKLYVTDLPAHYNESDVRVLFSQYGTIVECRLLLDFAGQSKCKAFVEYNSRDECDEAIIYTNGFVPDATTTSISVTYADPNYFHIKNLVRFQSEKNRGTCDLGNVTREMVHQHTTAAPIPQPMTATHALPSVAMHTNVAQPSIPSVTHVPGMQPIGAPTVMTSYVARYVVRIHGLPTYATVGHLFSMINTYGIVLSARIEAGVSDIGCICTGTAQVELAATSAMVEAALRTLNESVCFEGSSTLHAFLV